MTHISSAQAAKLFNAALFKEATRRPSLTNLMTGDAPQSIGEDKKGKRQTESGAPIVRITDLSKEAGDEVEVDIFHIVTGKPTMGDERIEGRGSNLSKDQYSLKIDQGRKLVDAGGRMTQKRIKHDINRIARAMLGDYYNRLEDESTIAHLAGMRSDFQGKETNLPPSGDPDLAKILVNPVTPPTFDRHFYGGDATSLTDLEAADILTLDVIDNLALQLDEMETPIPYVQFEKDEAAYDDPFRVLLVSPRQWNDFWTSASGKDFRSLQSNAMNRSQSFNHPVFKGSCAMWRGILVKKVNRPILINSGSSVTVCTDSDNAATTSVTAARAAHRAILLGGQALANAYGKTGKGVSGYHFALTEKMVDHDNTTELSIAWMNGKGKIRFKDKDGRINDHGVAVLDTAVS